MEYTNSQMQALIDEHIHSDRHAEILRLRLIHGHTYAVIGEEIDPPLEWKQVNRICSRESAKLFKKLRELEESGTQS